MISRKITLGTCLWLLTILVSLAPVWAVEFPDSKLIKMEKGKVTFESQDKEHSLFIGMGIKFHGLDGMELPFDDGVGMLQPGNIVQIVAAEDDTVKEPRIIFMRLIDGKIPGLKTKVVDLLPAPDFKGEITTGSLPQEWLDYFHSAKVGDFAEYKGFGRVRYEVLAVDGDSLTVARVVDTRGTRNEFREKLSITKVQQDLLKKLSRRAAEEKPKPKPKPTTSKSKKKLTPAQQKAQKEKEEREAAKAKAKEPTTEALTINGEELECQVEKLSAQSTLWTSPLVPFDHVVKRRRPNDNIELVKFGRGN